MTARAVRGEAARSVAARALSRRDLSRAALEERLRQAGVAPSDARKIVTELVRAGLVDDRRFAESLAEALAERGFGDAAITARLERELIAEAAARSAIAGLEPEEARARREARFSAAEGRRRLASRLARRGFGWEAIEAALGPLDEEA